MSLTFFGVQLVFRRQPDHFLDRVLRDRIASDRRGLDREENRRLFVELATAARRGLPWAELGAWDLVRGPEAQAEYDDWCQGIEEARGAAASPLAPDGEGFYLLTLVFLVVGGSASDLVLGEACDLPEEAWSHRETYDRLLGVVGQLHYSSIRSDAAYLVPNGEGLALDPQDFADEGWSYLQPLL